MRKRKMASLLLPSRPKLKIQKQVLFNEFSRFKKEKRKVGREFQLRRREDLGLQILLKRGVLSRFFKMKL